MAVLHNHLTLMLVAQADDDLGIACVEVHVQTDLEFHLEPVLAFLQKEELHYALYVLAAAHAVGYGQEV